MCALGSGRFSLAQFLKGGLCAAALVTGAADAQTLTYEVTFRGSLVATQQVALSYADGARAVHASFSADLPVFVAHHRIEEDLYVVYSTNGTVQQIQSKTVDGAKQVEVNGELQEDGVLRVVRSDMSGTTTNFIARDEYDLNSLTIYGNSPEHFIPTNSPARVLDVAEGVVVPTKLSTISESFTFERQNLASVHTLWGEGAYLSHTWHPERFSDLPQRYIRQTDAGEFVFSLIR